MKKFWKSLMGVAAIVAVIGMIWSTFAYNNRPMPFEDQKTSSNPVEDFINKTTDRIGEATEGFSLPDFGGSEEMTAPTTDVDLSQVRIAEPYYMNYERDAFGSAWKDVDGNSCDTRNDILARDLINIATSDSCTVTSGILEDDYTGTQIEFVRGGASEVDIDHIIPLSYANAQGAAMWTPEKREQFANDPVNLAASAASSNRSKGDKGPAEWLPENYSYHCEYGMQFANVAVKYDLAITQADYNAIANSCESL